MKLDDLRKAMDSLATESGELPVEVRFKTAMSEDEDMEIEVTLETKLVITKKVYPRHRTDFQRNRPLHGSRQNRDGDNRSLPPFQGNQKR